MDAKLLFVQAISPLHAGTGQGVGVIDMPIAREKATQIPFLPGSTLKGVFRDAATPNPDTEISKSLRKRIFGPDSSGDPSEHAGAVTFTDARLVLLPVRSLHGVFAWVTSPLLMRRLLRDTKDVTGLAPLPANIPAIKDEKDESKCIVSDGSSLPMSAGGNQKVILEDLPLGFTTSQEATQWATWVGKVLSMENEMKEHFCIVSDDTLSFLLETATEINARIRIDDDKKTVAQGQLWYEEALPTETILVSMVVASTIKNKEGKETKSDEVFQNVGFLSKKTLQFGGKATVGRGLCKTVLV